MKIQSHENSGEYGIRACTGIMCILENVHNTL